MKIVMYFRRKSGYMSPYQVRQALHIVRTYPGRGFPLAPLYIALVRTRYQNRSAHPRHFIIRPILIRKATP